MKKSERLNDLILYLQDKNKFNLQTIMNRYSISKSTALRDIQSLEEIGMPIFSKPGRNGYYGLLPNRLLSPIIFTIDEVQALYFSMLTFTAYQSTPFHLDINRMKRKFEGCISEETIHTLNKMENVFKITGYQSLNECPLLKDILGMAADESICLVGYKKDEVKKEYHVQFFDILSKYGQWYATGYNFQTERPQVFRCDKIESVTRSEKYQPISVSRLSEAGHAIYREENATDFNVGISPKAVDIYQKENYPSMELHQEGRRFFIKGFYNESEKSFIANYFLMYGNMITSIEPAELKTLLLERLKEIQIHLA